MKTNRLFYLVELAAVAALYFFENNSGTRAALAVSALVPLLSVLCAYRCSRKAAFSLDVPRHGEKSAPLVCRLCAPPLPLCEGRAGLRLQNAFTREEARAAAVVGEAVSLPVSHCGLLTVTAENAGDIGMIIGTADGALGPSCEFQEIIAEKGNAAGSAFRFPNTVYNAAVTPLPPAGTRNRRFGTRSIIGRKC